MIVSYKHFDNFILACILVSSALLAVEDTVDEDAKVNKVSKHLGSPNCQSPS